MQWSHSIWSSFRVQLLLGQLFCQVDELSKLNVRSCERSDIDRFGLARHIWSWKVVDLYAILTQDTASLKSDFGLCSRSNQKPPDSSLD